MTTKSRTTKDHNAGSINSIQRPHTSMGFSRTLSPSLEGSRKLRPSKNRKKADRITDKPLSNTAFVMTANRTRQTIVNSKYATQNDNNNARIRPYTSQSRGGVLPAKQEGIQSFRSRKYRPKTSRLNKSFGNINEDASQEYEEWESNVRNQERIDTFSTGNHPEILFDNTRNKYNAKALVDGSFCTIIDLEDNEEPEEEEREEIGYFSSLKLDEEEPDEFYETDLEEDFPEPLPEEYDPSGKNLYVKLCSTEGLVPVSYLFKRMANCELTMKHHGLGPHGTKPFAEALKKNTCIQQLNLTDNGLGSIGAIFMATMLYENFYITDLDLSENLFQAEGGIAFARVLHSNQSLRKLTLKGNHLSDRVAKAFAESLKENRTLTYLDLSYNEFGELGGLYLGAGLAVNYGLRILNLKWNGIARKGAVSMATALKSNDSLLSLNLGWNGLSFIGALALTRHLKKNEVLTDLDISNNRISPKGAQRLALALAVHPAMRSFKIGMNPLGDDGVTAILNATRRNTNIQYLGLEDITVSPIIHKEILKLEDLRDILIVTGGKTRHTQEKPPPSGMEILIQFIQDNRLRLKDLFFQFDKDHSGDISKEEFKVGLKESGIQMSNKQLDALIDSIDIDGNNKIEYSEILYGREAVLKERRFQRKVAFRTEQREKESIELPKLKGF